MENLTDLAKNRGYKIVIEVNPLCWEEGLDVTPDDVKFSLVPRRSGAAAVRTEKSVAALGEWLTSRFPIGSFCPKHGLYKSSCEHREIKMDADQPFPPCPVPGCIDINWSPVRIP